MPAFNFNITGSQTVEAEVLTNTLPPQTLLPAPVPSRTPSHDVHAWRTQEQIRRSKLAHPPKNIPMQRPSMIASAPMRPSRDVPTPIRESRVVVQKRPILCPPKPHTMPDKKLWHNDAGLFLGRSFRACFSPAGELFTVGKVYRIQTEGSTQLVPARAHGHAADPMITGSENRAAAGSQGEGAYRVEVIPMVGRLFHSRSYIEQLKLHENAFSNSPMDFKSLMNAARRYAELSKTQTDCNGSRQQGHAVWTLLHALNERDERSVMEKLSEWLEISLREAPSTKYSRFSSVDKAFVHLTSREVLDACESIWNEDSSLALLIAQIGQHTSLAHDMAKQVEWLENYGEKFKSKSFELDPESNKILQMYRLLSGNVDTLLEKMRDQIRENEDGSLKLPGGKLLDWKRGFALYLWYACADPELVKVPPEGMPGSCPEDMRTHSRMGCFHDAWQNGHNNRNILKHFSVRGAFLHFMSQLSTKNAIHVPIVSHPFPAYLEDSSSAPIQQAQVLRNLWGQRRMLQREIPQMPPDVVRNVDRCVQFEPGTGLVTPYERPLQADSPKQVFLQSDWPVDICFHLLHLLHMRDCGQDTSLAKILCTETHSREAMDYELAWHLYQVVVQTVRPHPFSPPGAPPDARHASYQGRLIAERRMQFGSRETHVRTVRGIRGRVLFAPSHGGCGISFFTARSICCPHCIAADALKTKRGRGGARWGLG